MPTLRSTIKPGASIDFGFALLSYQRRAGDRAVFAFHGGENKGTPAIVPIGGSMEIKDGPKLAAVITVTRRNGNRVTIRISAPEETRIVITKPEQ